MNGSLTAKAYISTMRRRGLLAFSNSSTHSVTRGHILKSIGLNLSVLVTIVFDLYSPNW